MPSHPSHPSHIDHFCRLVRHCGTDYQFLLTIEEIEAELSAEDRAELETLDPHNRRVWAELLAYRLTKDRTIQQG